MDLWARIKGKEYKVASGASFSDELGETLDSGNIRIVHVHEVIDLKPYDDIIIHDEKFDKKYMSYEKGYEGQGFYKHMLCFSIQREQLSIDENDLSENQMHPNGQQYRSWYFNYSISLVSEIKALEKIQLPNRTVTQPMRTTDENTNSKAKTLYDVANEMIELYSPYIKQSEDGIKWDLKRKYHFYNGNNTEHFGYSVIQLLKSKNCPEMSFQLPNLREVLNRIFQTVDAIPTIKDGIIGYLSLSDRKNQFKVWESDENGNLKPTSVGFFGRDVWQMDGSSYTDRIIREHSNSLSKYSVIHMVEDLGLKNSDSGKLTLENMRLELTYPIYELKKIYMCYWKTNDNGKTIYKVKQDITKMVIRNEKRNLLSEDWTKYSWQNITSEEEFRKFKYATIGYSQYSKYITGWGQKYSYITNYIFTNISHTNTVIENIYKFYNKLYPNGTLDIKKYSEKLDDDTYKLYFQTGELYKVYGDEVPTYGNDKTSIFEATGTDLKDYLTGDDSGWFTNFTLFLKTVFFEVEYDGMISSSIVMSKHEHDGPIVTRDNPSNSLAFIENDGVNENEKVNRLGNASLVLEQVAKTVDDLLGIADYRTDDPLIENEEPLHKDEIVYRRSYTVFKDHIDAQYNLCKDYVLRNYFTSVYAKLRPFAYTSYGESVERKENKYVQIFLSLEHSYYQTYDSYRNVYIENTFKFVKKMLSFYKPTDFDSNNGNVVNDDISNCAYMYIPKPDKTGEGIYWGLFEFDFLKYSSGNSLCFNITMQDSASAGVYMSRYAPNFGTYVINTLFTKVGAEKNLDLLSSSLQEWYMLTTDKDTGSIDEIHFGIGNNEKTMINKMYCMTDIAKKQSVLAPQMWTSIANLGDLHFTNSIGVRYYENGKWYDTSTVPEKNKYGDKLSTFMKAKFYSDPYHMYKVNKDGTEKLNITLETEFINDNNIFISNKAVMLSDAYGSIEKIFDKELEVSSFDKPHISKNWSIWRGFVWYGNNTEFLEAINMIPSLNICFNSNDRKIGNTKEFKEDEMKFTWAKPDGTILTVWIEKVSWVSIAEAYNQLKNKIINYYPDYSEELEWKNYTDIVFVSPKITLHISLNNKSFTYYVEVFPYQIREKKDDEYIKDINYLSGNMQVADTLQGGINNFNNYIIKNAGVSSLRSVLCDPFDSDTYKTWEYKASMKKALIQSMINYNPGNELYYAISFSGFGWQYYSHKKNGTYQHYITDYFFNGAGQPTKAFKEITEGYIDYNSEGIILANSNYMKITDDTSGDDIVNTISTDTDIEPTYNYVSNIISHIKILSSQVNEIKSRNMLWTVFDRQLKEKDVYTEYNEVPGDSMEMNKNTASNIIASYVLGKVTFGFPKTIPVNGSVALYYKENNMWSFVFGMNNKTGEATKKLSMYVSLIENREKTVYDIYMDPIYKIADYAKDDLTYGVANYVSGIKVTPGSDKSDTRKKYYYYTDAYGGIIQSGELNEDGTAPDFTGVVPTIDSDGEYIYIFNNWSMEYDENGNLIFIPFYDSIKIPTTGDGDKINQETESTTWKTLQEIKEALGSPTTGIILISEIAASDVDSGLTLVTLDAYNNWPEEGKQSITGFDDKVFRFYQWGENTPTISWNVETNEIKTDVMGINPEMQAIYNQLFSSENGSVTTPWNDSTLTATEWNSGNYKYYISAAINASYYKYIGTKDADLKNSNYWEEIEALPSELLENVSFIIGDASHVYVKCYTAKI